LLHILADTLGSVGVIVSAVLMSQFGWYIADPICSLFIGTLVALSVLPLLRDSTVVLMQRTPKELDGLLTSLVESLKDDGLIRNITHVHVWTLCSSKFVASLTLTMAKHSTNQEQQSAKASVKQAFKRIHIDTVCVEVEFEN